MSPNFSTGSAWLVSQAQRREEVDALLHAGRNPNLVRALAYLERADMVEGIYFEFWEQSLAKQALV